MSYIKINNKLIMTPLEVILKQLREESTGRYLHDIVKKNGEVLFTCPFHKDGNERRASCSIHDVVEDSDYGIYHCFTCGSSGTLVSLVSQCLGVSNDVASEWLEERFADVFVETEEFLPEIELTPQKSVPFLDEKVLDEYSYFHPYQFQRGLTEELIRKFKIGATPDGEYVTFPCWDEHGHLVGVYKRSVVGKRFIIPKNIEKCVYLLNYAIKEGKQSVVICEGQFDALISWKYGMPAVALFGAGTSKEQMDILNRSGIFHFILMYDNDEAGHKGAARFKKFIRNDKLVTEIEMPLGKDIASCTEAEFKELLTKYQLNS